MKEHPKGVMAYLHDLMVTTHWFLANPIKAANMLSQFTNSSVTQNLAVF